MKAVEAIKTVLFPYILLMITYFYTFYREHKPKWCFFLAILFVIGLGGFRRVAQFIMALHKRRKTVFQPSFLNGLSIKTLTNPEVFGIVALICFALLYIRETFHLTIPTRLSYGLFIPVLLLGFAYILNLFLKSGNKTICSWRKLFIKKIYRRHPFLVKAYILASYGLAVGLLFAYSCFIFKSSYYHLEWYFFGFFDKRDVFFTYLLFMVGFLFSPYFYSALVHRRFLISPSRERIFKPFWKKAAHLTIAVIIASYFWGPPWNIGLCTNWLDPHEVVHLGPLLAIKQGKIPYTEAIIQYGPGVQIFQYFYLNLFGFDMLHLRESFYLFHFVFTLIFFSCVWLYLNAFEASVVTFFCLLMQSILGSYGFQNTGVPIGFSGWGVGFRYLAPPLLVLAMAHQFTRTPSRIHPFLIGCIYGFLLYMAQENLSCGLMTIGLGCALAYFCKYATWEDLKRFGTYFGLGTLLFLMPVLIFYASHHQLAQFISRYFAVSSAVIQGFSNTRWSTGFTHPLYLPYAITPYLLFLIGFYALYSDKKNRFAISKDKFRVLLVVISAIALHQISLFRADSTHFMATCLALPILFGLIFCNIMKSDEISKKQVIGYASTTLLLIVAIYPATFNLKSFIPSVIERSSRYFVACPRPDPNDEFFFPPFGFSENKTEGNVWGHIQIAEFVEEMKKMKQIIGERPTIVDFSAANITGCTSSFYFFANLNIGTKMIESLHSIINSLDREEFIQEIRSNPIQCFVTDNLKSKETLVFLERFPEPTIYHRKLGKFPYYIILCNS